MSTAPRPQIGIGLQLYTVRALAATDLLTTIDRVAEAGYHGVELAGLHGVDASKVRDRCADVGLTVIAAHIGLTRFELEPDRVAAELAALGADLLVFPSLPAPSEAADGTAVVRRLGDAVAKARARGLRPAFHNHAHEFAQREGGARLWDAIVAVEKLELELDLGWVWVAGEDPAALLAEHRGRIPLVHVKDFVRTDDGARDCPVGEGEVDYATLIPAALDAGVEWLVVEQDEPGLDPLDAISRSRRGVSRLLPVE